MKKILFLMTALTVGAWADATIRVGGAKWATVQDNGILRVQTAPVGEVEKNGTIRRNGTKVGEIDSKGRIRLGNDLVGEIDKDGKLIYGGQTIGSLDATKGEILRKGQVWGQVEGLSDKNRRSVGVMLLLFREDFPPK